MTTQQLPPLPENAPQRRIAPLPLLLAAVGVVLAIVFTVVIVSLAMGRPQAGPPPVGQVAPPVAQTPAAPPEAAPESRRTAETNECVDALADGTIDIDAARADIDHGRLSSSITLAEPLPEGSSTVGIYAVSENGETIYQLATTWRDGELDEFVVQRFGVDARDDNRGRGNDDRGDDAVETDNLDLDGVNVDSTTITAEYPRAVERDLGDAWRWYAFAAIDGTEVDACPGATQTFETQPFER